MTLEPWRRRRELPERLTSPAFAFLAAALLLASLFAAGLLIGWRLGLEGFALCR